MPTFGKPDLAVSYYPEPPLAAPTAINVQNPALGKMETHVFGGYTKLEEIAIKLAVAQVHESGMASAKGCVETAEAILAECAKREGTQVNGDEQPALIMGSK